MDNHTGCLKRLREDGVRLRTVNGIVIFAAVVLSVLLLLTTAQTSQSYSSMQTATDLYFGSWQDMVDIEEASDYLTDQARSFAATGQTEYINNYFREIGETRRRERAMEDLKVHFEDSETYRFLNWAIADSSNLESLEYYSMRLTVAARDLNLSRYPQEVQNVTLSEEDLALTPEAQSRRATDILYSGTYQAYKKDIQKNIEKSTTSILEQTQRDQVESTQRLLRLLQRQYVLIAALLLAVLIVVILNTTLIIHPLQRSVEHIRNQQELPLTGSLEMRFLARAYNRMFEENRLNHAQLSYDASHDDLTGLLNRGEFDRIREACDQADVALLLIDVDHFKTVNDTYGHDTGDRILKKVAAILTESFRGEDLICRIGGDEFAVVMVHAGSHLRELVAGKIRRANQRLREPDDGLPAVSLSVGVAFGDRENPTDDIFKDADAALYRVKEAGRNGCAFYE